MLTVLLMTLTGAFASVNESTPVKVTEKIRLQQDWSQDAMFRLSSEIHLSSPIWLRTFDTNEQARALTVSLDAYLHCLPSQDMTVRCKVNDFSMRAAAVIGDDGLLGPILEDIDARVTHQDVVLRLDKLGSIRSIDLEGIQWQNRRMNTQKEILRQLFKRALAGFDLDYREQHISNTGLWGATQNELFGVVTSEGTYGGARIRHQAYRRGEYIDVYSAGKAVVSTGTTLDIYALEAKAIARLNEDGLLLRREWSCTGEPTPSSISVEGLVGVPYNQFGIISRVDEMEPLPATEEQQRPTGSKGASTLQMWQSLLGAGF